MRKQMEQIILSGTVDPDSIARSADGPAGSLSFQLNFEEGKVDVNNAPAELIKLALQAARTDAGTVETVMAAIAELRRRRMAVADPAQLFPIESRTTGRSANEQSRFLTTFSGSRGINPSLSERELLDQLVPENAAGIAQRGTGAGNVVPGSWQGLFTSSRATIALTGTYRHKDGWALRRKVVFRIDRGRHSVQILAWRTFEGAG